MGGLREEDAREGDSVTPTVKPTDGLARATAVLKCLRPHVTCSALTTRLQAQPWIATPSGRADPRPLVTAGGWQGLAQNLRPQPLCFVAPPPHFLGWGREKQGWPRTPAIDSALPTSCWNAEV